MAGRTEWYRMMLVVIADLKIKLHENMEEIDPEMMGFFENLEQIVLEIADGIEAQSVIYPNIKAIANPLAKRGWFVTAYFRHSQMLALGQRCLEVSETELDLLLLEMYKSSVDDIAESLVGDFPERAFAIKPAIDAHKRGEYALSILVFFAHAEGISFSVLKKYLFTDGKPKKGGLSENIKTLAHKRLEAMHQFVGGTPFEILAAMNNAMWLSFSETLPLSYGPKDREEKQYLGLNRNTIMHGLALEEQATEENSLKALSLLSSIASLAQGESYVSYLKE